MGLGSIRGTVRDQYGRPTAGVTIQVNIHSSTAATIYQDRAGTTLANPFTNQDDGSFEFFANTTNRYDLVFSATGLTFDNTDYTDMGVDMVGDSAVAAQHLATDAVYTAAIQALAVTTAKIDNNAVTGTKLASDSTVDVNRAVSTNHVRDASITTAKLAENSVTSVKLSSDDTTDANRAVTTDSIKDVNVTEPKLADDAVSTRTIVDGAVTLDKLDSTLSAIVPGSAATTFEEEFFVQDGTTAMFGIWAASGFEVGTSVYGHPGIAKKTSAGSAAMYVTAAILHPADSFSSTFVLDSANGSSTKIAAGFQDGAGFTPANAILVRCDNSTGWSLVTRSSSSETVVTLGVAQNTGFHTLKLWRQDATTIAASIDGGSAVTTTLTVPTGDLYPNIQITYTGTSPSVDYASFNLGYTR
jgi:hypothetical protein